MARSTWCEWARQAAQPTDDVSAALIRLLKLPIEAREKKKIVARVKALRTLFAGLDQPEAQRLHARLTHDSDPLAQFFDCELATWLRNELRGTVKTIAERKQPSPTPPVPGPTDRETDDTATDDTEIEDEGDEDEGDEDEGDEDEDDEDEDGDDGPPEPRLPQLPILEGEPLDIIGTAKDILKRLRRLRADPKLIGKLERLLRAAAPIVATAGVVLGLYYFAKGRLVQQLVAQGVAQRILHRFEIRGKAELERILRELTETLRSNELQEALEEPLPVQQMRDPRGRFRKKEPGHTEPGKDFEKEVCKQVHERYPFAARQVKIKRYAPRVALPGQKPQPGLVLRDPVAFVDCIGAILPTKGLVLYEAKESGPADFTNPGLTANQKIVYPALLQYGGEIVASKGPFRKGTKIPKGTRVRIITPANLKDI